MKIKSVSAITIEEKGRKGKGREGIFLCIFREENE